MGQRRTAERAESGVPEPTPPEPDSGAPADARAAATESEVSVLSSRPERPTHAGADPELAPVREGGLEGDEAVPAGEGELEGATTGSGTLVADELGTAEIVVPQDAADLQGDDVGEPSLPTAKPPVRGWRRTKLWLILAATIRSCMRYRVTGLAAEGAFFGLLSLPPLIFGLAGTIGYVLGIFGVGTIEQVRSEALEFARTLLTESSVQDVIEPMLDTVLAGGRADVISIGFVLALWSGSRALNVFIDTVSIMYGQGGHRGIVKTRALSFSLYTVGLFSAVTVLPLVLVGPSLVHEILPRRLDIIGDLYWPVVIVLSAFLLTSVYHLAVPLRGRWRNELPGAGLVFVAWIVGSQVLRIVLSESIGGTSIYGPLAAPIVVLMWLYFIVISVLIGGALNASLAQVMGWRRARPDKDEEKKEGTLRRLRTWLTARRQRGKPRLHSDRADA